MYKFVRDVLFMIDPEKVHYLSMNSLKTFCKLPFIRKYIQKRYTPAKKSVTIAGITFNNRVGLGAGFDKNAKYLSELEALGFGYVEIGTVTPIGQDGNAKPRLFRLPDDKALINRMGFNNDGAEVIAERLKTWKTSHPGSELIIGGNIGKNKSTPNDEAWKDYELCFHSLHDYVDYFVVNVSSPNTPGLRELQDKDVLHKILKNLQHINKTKNFQKPIFLKLAPDLTFTQLDEIIDLITLIKLDGVIIANTTVNRSQLHTSTAELEHIGQGGLSGKPLNNRCTEIIRYINNKISGQLIIIASGGIFTAADANKNIEAGASLIQVWTGFIYEGPSIVKNISNSL